MSGVTRDSNGWMRRLRADDLEGLEERLQDIERRLNALDGQTARTSSKNPTPPLSDQDSGADER